MNETFDNRGLLNIFLILSIFFLYSCASTHHSDYSHDQSAHYAVASWYGKKFNGKSTASGERFDMYEMTCAHKTLPFGTKLRVTNPENNKWVIVTVNDRGPFIPGRDLDLSYGAAKKIGIVKQGVERVKIEHVP